MDNWKCASCLHIHSLDDDGDVLSVTGFILRVSRRRVVTFSLDNNNYTCYYEHRSRCQTWT